jgi:hypothetical protein
MTQTIRLPDDLYARLESVAKPFVDREPADVIRRLLESYQADEGRAHVAESNNDRPPRLGAGTSRIEGRAPRERGARVRVDDHTIVADSVPDLFDQALHYVAEVGKWDCLVSLAPYKTSAQRYLIASDPVHPSGKPFFVPIKHRGIHMETHKNYATALTQLERLLAKCGIDMTYLGS